MLLSQDIIFYQLSKYFDAIFTFRSHTVTEFKKPRFFENSEFLSGHVIIADKNNISDTDAIKPNFRNSLMIYIGGALNYSEPICSSSILITNHVPFTAVFNRLMEIYDQFTEWEHLLELSLHDKDGYKKIIDSCTMVTPETVCLMDKEFQYVAYSDFASNQGLIESENGHDDALPKYILEEYYTLPDADKIRLKKDVFFRSFTFGDSFLKNLFYQDKYIGRIAVRTYGCQENELRYYTIIFEKIAECIVNIYAKYQTFWIKKATTSEFRYLLNKYIADETVSIHEWNKELTSIGWERTDDLQLIQFSPDLRYDKQPYSKHIITETEKLWKNCIGSEYDGKTLLLVNYTYYTMEEKKDFYQLLVCYLRENLLIAGISRNFKDPNYMSGAYIQTQIAITEGLSAAPTQWCFHFDDIALHYMLSSSLGKFSNYPMYLYSEKLQKLKEHDKIKGTEYYATLYQYFECKLNASETAKKLYIHRSSLLNRLQRIDNLISVDFNSNEELLYLSLSFWHINNSQISKNA
ncbi:MAG: PucR family transcriptional regulator [Anaerofustis sp.]